MDITHFLSLPMTIYGWVGLAAFIISGVLFVRNNDVKSLRAANNDLRESLKDKQSQISDLQLQIDKLRALVDKMEAVLHEKDKRIDALEHVQIVQQQSPDDISYRQDMKNFASQVHQYMIDTRGSLSKIETMLSERTPLFTDIEKKLEEIDTKV